MTTTPRPVSADDPRGTGGDDPVPLRLVAVETVEPDGPFHPRTTLIKPSHFPSPFDAQSRHDYRAVTFVDGHPTGLRASFTDDAPTVRLEIHLPPGAETDPRAAAAVLRSRLGLDLALPGYGDLCADDEVLSRLPAAMHGARPSSPWSLYEYLSIGTVLQNTTVARTVQMARALAGLMGTWYRFPDDVVLASFWNPGDVVDLGEAALRQAKLGYRAKTLTRLGAQFQADPDTETRLRTLTGDPRALRAGLRALYGVGPATTGYLMFDVFKSLDELSHLPPWEAKILGRLLFDDPDADPAATIAWCHDHWAPTPCSPRTQSSKPCSGTAPPATAPPGWTTSSAGKGYFFGAAIAPRSPRHHGLQQTRYETWRSIRCPCSGSAVPAGMLKGCWGRPLSRLPSGATRRSAVRGLLTARGMVRNMTDQDVPGGLPRTWRPVTRACRLTC